jgi:hypothetical protein
MLCDRLLINIAHREASISLEVRLFYLTIWQTYYFVFNAFITGIWALRQGLSSMAKSVGPLKPLVQNGLLHRIASKLESAVLEGIGENFNMT